MQEINARGIVLWHSGLRLHLQCLPPVWAPVQVPVDPLLIQSPVNVLRKQWNMVLETKKLLPPASATWEVNQQVESLPLSPSSIFQSDFQIKI